MPWARLALVFPIVTCIPPGSARIILVNYILSVGMYQPVTLGTAKELTKLTKNFMFTSIKFVMNFMLVIRTVFTVVLLINALLKYRLS